MSDTWTVQPSGQRRRGHTLLEMMLSLTIIAMVTASIGSAVMFAAKATPGAQSVEATLGEDGAAMSQIAEDIAVAQFIVELSDNSITVVVNDRTGDGYPDKITYAWSGVVGGPLTYQINDGRAYSLLDSVATFKLDPVLDAITTELPVATYWAEESSIAGYASTGLLGGSTEPVRSSDWQGQTITASLSSRSHGFMPTRVLAYCESKSPYDGQAQVRLVDRSGNTPGSTVFGTQLFQETALPTSMGWYEVALDEAAFVARDQDTALLFEFLSGSNEVMEVGRDLSLSGGLLSSDNNGASWSPEGGKTLVYQVYGEQLVNDSAQYRYTRNHVTHIEVSLQSVSSERSPMARLVRAHHSPQVLTKFWMAEFDADPTGQNVNGDSVSDWGMRAGTFSDTGLSSGGRWSSNQEVVARPSGGWNGVTTIDARVRASGTGEVSIYGPLHVNGSSQQLPCLFKLRYGDTGGQELILYRDLDGTSPATTISNLGDEWLDLKLIAIPETDSVWVSINGEMQGGFKLSRESDEGLPRSIWISGDSLGGSFEHVYIGFGGSVEEIEDSGLVDVIGDVLGGGGVGGLLGL